MYCKYCGKFNSNRAFYCKECGKSVPKINWFRKHSLKLAITIPVIVIAGLYLINAGLASAYINIFPFWSMNPKTVTLSCSYSGKNLQVETTTYGNINNYYKNYNLSEKTEYIEKDQFEKFVYVNQGDKTIKNLVASIKKVASANKLNEDQTLELAACFVQNIPYDDSKANIVLADNSQGNTANSEQYPYQTLYLNKGICTDKAYLGSAILKELGYGTALMIFPADKHMALSISVPLGYGSFNSGYSILDVTIIGFSPGVIPTKMNNNGMPYNNIDNVNQLSPNESPDTINLNADQTISSPQKIIPINTGKIYTRIVPATKLYNEIVKLYNSLDPKKANLQKAYSNIEYWNNKQAQAYVDYLATPSTTQNCMPVFSIYGSYSRCYTSTNLSKNFKYNTYSAYFNNYKNAINNYNNLVDDYNITWSKIKSDYNSYKTYQYN